MPYFGVAGTDWPAELNRALRSAATDDGEEAFTRTLRLLVAALHDGHGNVLGPGRRWDAALPILWSWLEDQLVVTAVAPEGAQELAPGDVVEAIDGRPSREALAESERLTSAATPQWARFRALRELRSGPDDSTVALDVRTAAGERRKVTLERTAAATALAETRPEKIAEVRPGIFYVDVARISDEDWKAALPKLAQARGVVFDVRGYPRALSPAPLQHLTDKPIQSALWNVPLLTVPDWKGTPGWNTDGRWDLAPLAPRLAGRIVFLTDGSAISYAESWMGIVEAYKLGEIVGEPTAGTNVNPFKLPGGCTIYWTGMKVLKHDGSLQRGHSADRARRPGDPRRGRRA